MRKRRPWDPPALWNWWVGWSFNGMRIRRMLYVDGFPVYYLFGRGHWHAYTIDNRRPREGLWLTVPEGFLSNLPPKGRKEWVAMTLRKLRDNPLAITPISDATTQKRWPTLWDHLTQRFWDEKRTEPRQTSTITLFMRDDGRLGATLNDRSGSKACFAVGLSLMALLDTLEAVAGSEDTVWREDRQQTGSSARKKN